MLVLLWGQHPTAEGVIWSLDAVGAVGFRCSNACTQEPPRPTQPPEQLLRSMEGWQGTRETWLDDQVEPCEAFSAEQFAVHPLTATFVDGLICSAPEHLPQGSFRLQIGCRTSAEAFQQISLVFNEQQSLELCERRCYWPASIEGDG